MQDRSFLCNFEGSVYPVEAPSALEVGIIVPELVGIGEGAVESGCPPQKDYTHLVVVFTGDLERPLLDRT